MNTNQKSAFSWLCIKGLIVFAISWLVVQHSTSQTLVWQDEFNTNTLNTNVWTYDFGDGCGNRNLCGWGNAELQNYTTRPENVRIENGNLIIEGRRENYANSSFTSGRIKTEGRVHFKYGTLEARIKIPNLANGLWPAFWTLGTIGGVWPNIGEMDIMEMGSQSARLAGLINKQVSAATHRSSNGAHSIVANQINASVDLNGDYHIYKLVWNSSSITMYLDGTSFFTMDISNPTSNSSEEFHNPHFILLNMAIGGAYTGLLNASSITATMPAQMMVDYVRLYQNNSDQLILGTQNSTSGNFGIYSESAIVTDSLIVGTNATLNYWNNLTAITGATTYEGNKVWALRANAGNWFGMGLDNKYMNLSGHSNGALKFHFKTAYNGQFKIGIKSGDGESWINFPAGSNAYGLVRDGNWHEISIPLLDFRDTTTGRYVDFMSVKSAFMFAGDAPSSNADFYIDNLYISKTTVSPTLGTFSVPAKVLGDAPFVLTPPTSNSSGSFSYASSNASVATISGNTVTVVGAGTANITATQAPNGNYGSASKTANLVVTVPSPSTAAPVPPARNSSDYVSLFSNSYTNVVGTDWFPNWGQTTVVTDVSIAGNNAKKYEQFNYQGVQLSGAINVSALTNLHIDIWTPNCTSFELYLINTSPSIVEQKVTLTPTMLGWNSYDIALTQFPLVALNNIAQLKLTGTPVGTSIVYLDNIYFWRSSNLPALSNFSFPVKNVGDPSFTITAPTSNSLGSFSYSSSNTSVATISGNTLTIVGAGTSTITATQAAYGSYASGTISATLLVSLPGPTTPATTPPTRNSSDYVSIYSDAYTNVSGTDFNPYWNQTTLVSDYPISGNNNKKYDQFNYQGIQLASPINLSGMQYLHIDLWSPNCTGFDFYLINTSPALVEQKITVTPTLNGWNSYNIPLSQFNTIALNNVSQFKLEARPFGTTVMYWDNLYFWKSSAVSTPTLSILQPTCTSSTGTITVTSSITGLTFSIDGVNYNNTTGVFAGLSPGNYSVTAKNTSGVISSPATAVIVASLTIPAIPSAINGTENINQCDTSQSYSVPSSTGVTYTWTVTGTGNYIRSGQGTSAVVIVMKNAGTISVKASNNCGSSVARTLSVIKAVPATPVTVTYNSTNFCSYTSSAFSITGIKDTFRVRRLVNVKRYIWQIPVGANSQTLNDTTIAVLFPDTLTLSSPRQKNVSVFAVSECDTGLAKSILLTRTLPTSPAAIQQSFVPSVGALTNVAGVTSAVYRIRKVASATSYSWYMRLGTKATIVRLNATGPNDTAVSITFASGFTRDTLVVTANNGCGSSAIKTLALSAMAAPSAPTAISGKNNPCRGDTVLYIATVGLLTSTTSPTVKYRWTIPTTAVIVSSNTDSSQVRVRFGSTYIGGSIVVKSVSAVGVVSATGFTLTLKYASAVPSSIVSKSGLLNFCIENRDTFKVTMPTLTASQAAPVVFRWTKPVNTSFVYANADSSIVLLSFNTGYTGGILSVKSQTVCGVQSTTAKSVTLTHTGCPAGTENNPKVIANKNTPQNFSDFKLKIFPNPNNGQFSIKLENGILKDKEACVTVRDFMGRMVLARKIKSEQGINIFQINHQLSSGIYFVEVETEQSKKVIKMTVNDRK
jgi:beta-glucanase (GH16 family)